MPWGGLVSSVLQRARARRLHATDEEMAAAVPGEAINGKTCPTSPERLLPLASMVQKWRSAVQHSRVVDSAALVPPTDSAVDAGENGEVCLVIKSPYRILRCAASGNLKSFKELHQDDPKRLEFRDAQRSRGPAHYAAANNQAEILRYIAAVDGDLDAVDTEGQTPLHLAVESGSLAAAACLIECGAATNVLDAALRSPLHLAVVQDQPDVLRLLATHRDRVDCKQLSEHGRDALHIAAVLNRAECARVLLDDFGMRPCSFCNNGFTPIHEAARRASFATMQVFTNWGEGQGCGGERMMLCPDIEGNLPLHLAVHSGDVKAVQLCLRFGAKISSQQNDLSTPVHLACVQGSLEITQMLFDAQPEEKWTVLNLRDSSDMTPLHCAAKFDHALLVEYLAKQGADLNVLDSEERTPLLVAVLRSSWAAARTLLKLGAEADIPDLGGRNLLHFLVMNSGRVDDLISACSSGQQPFARMINEPDAQGCTPLHYASRHGHIRCLQRLMDLGACPNVKDANNESPLHFAARYGRYNTVRSLLSSRKGQFIINGIDSAGRTPLHIASENGYSRVVQLLISRGALLNRDFQGLTPLHLAAREGFTRTMELLLTTHTQLLDQRDKTGCTALHWACLANKPSAINLLLSLNCALLANNEGSTAMDFCIKHKLVEAARAMLTNATSSERVLSDVSGRYKSIVSALIETMPKVLEDVMDRQISFANCKKDSEAFFIKYNLSMFEPGEKRIQAIRESRGDARWRPEPLREVNHMVHHGRIDLLMHPLTQRYLAMKWQAYGRFCHLFSLVLYAIFVFLVTLNAMNLMRLVRHCPVLLDADGSVHVYKPEPQPHGAGGGVLGELTADGADTGADGFGLLTDGGDCDIHNIINSKSESLWSYVIMVSVIVFGILNLLKKMLQMWNQSWNFVTDFENYMELAMYVSALISVTPVFHPVVTHCHVITSAITVFLAWFSMLLYLRSFESVGIYVVMFVEIQKTLLRVLIIFSVLIIAFGLSFYILLSSGNHPEFSSVPMSLVRTFNMMLGEIDFLTVYVYPWLANRDNGTVMAAAAAQAGGGRRGGFRTDQQLAAAANLSSSTVPISGLGSRFLPFATTSFLLVIVFMVMMPILLMNLLVGLAVGDIEAVRKNAALKRLAMQVDLHTGLERKLPQAFLERVKRTELIEYPNTAARLKQSKANPLRRLVHLALYLVTPSHGAQMKTFDYLEHAAIAEQNHQYRELDKVKRRLKETSRTVDSVHKLMRLVIVKLEIGMEAEDEDEGGDAEHELLNAAAAAGGGTGAAAGTGTTAAGTRPGLLTVPARTGSRLLSPSVSQRRARAGSRRRGTTGTGGTGAP